MALENGSPRAAAATGADQGELRRRNVSGQPNGNYVAQIVDEKIDPKTKQQVGPRSRRDSLRETRQAAEE